MKTLIFILSLLTSSASFAAPTMCESIFLRDQLARAQFMIQDSNGKNIHIRLKWHLTKDQMELVEVGTGKVLAFLNWEYNPSDGFLLISEISVLRSNLRKKGLGYLMVDSLVELIGVRNINKIASYLVQDNLRTLEAQMELNGGLLEEALKQTPSYKTKARWGFSVFNETESEVEISENIGSSFVYVVLSKGANPPLSNKE